jgi:hypothetical protein
MPGSASRRDGGHGHRIGLVAPIWDLSVGPLLKSFLESGRKPVWMGPQAFRFGDRSSLSHDDWSRGDWSKLTGIVVAAICGKQDSELFEWRRAVLEEIALAGIPVLPDPRGIRLAWEPTRVLLRLSRAGVSVIDHYVGENLDDAFDFVRTWKGAQYRIPEGAHALEIEWVAQSNQARDRLEELWQEYPTGPFVLTRDVRGEVVSLFVLGGEVAAAWRGGTPGLEAEHVAETARNPEIELAIAASRAFGLDPVVVDIVRDARRPQVHGVRPLGYWKALFDAHPTLATPVCQKLEAMLNELRDSF